MKKTILDRVFRYNHLYKIVNKDSNVVTFKPNRAQRWVRGVEQKMRAEFGRVRMVILKARQLGMTTYKLVEGLDTALFYSNQNVLIVAHDREKADEFFKRVQFMYSQLPEEILDDKRPGGVWKKPKHKYSNKRELMFSGNNSQIKVVIDARSTTPSRVHITELAFRRDAEDMMVGATPAIPESADVTIETTANGVGNHFHDIWTKNYNNPEAEYHCVFIPRHSDKDYVSSDYRAIPGALTTLKKLFDSGSVTQEQVNWYVKGYNKLGKKWLQENPSTPEEAFLVTGEMFFDKVVLSELDRTTYDIDSVYPQLRLYNKDIPKQGVMYGIDTSMGGSEGDFSSISIRNKEGRLLAFYMDRVQPHALCEVVDYLWSLGYKGIIGPEKNGESGGAFIERAREYEWHRKIYTEKVIDRKTKKKTKKYGWSTNGKTRPIMLSDLQEAVLKGWLYEFDERQIRDMYTFLYVDGRPEAQIGCHDDTVMADAICWQMRNEQQSITIDYA